MRADAVSTSGGDDIPPHTSASSVRLGSPYRPFWASHATVIFAAKTTASGLLALLIAFTFNLDQPQWTLLTVFIVAQPRQDGLVFAKSFFRIIGTVVGAVVALLLVASVAQERVLFLGALAVWIGVCTFGSQYAQGWAGYAFVLSGYTVAIVGIPGALDPGNAFYIALARVTEVTLGIVVTATIAHLILPDSFAASLQQAIAKARMSVGDFAISVCHSTDTIAQRAALLGQAAAIEESCHSAIFADEDIRNARHRIAHLSGVIVDVVASAQCLGGGLGDLSDSTGPSLEVGDAIADASGAIAAWQSGAHDGNSLRHHLVQANHRLTLVSEALADEAHGLLALRRLQVFLDAVCAFAEADEALCSGRRDPASRLQLTRPDDFRSAASAGLRSVLAVAIASTFWILADWPHGSTATILAAVATARLATMGHAIPLAILTALVFSFSTVPAFVVVDVILPLASGFPAFAIAVAPVLFVCALLMAYERTMVLGYMSVLLFASVGAFQDRMVYDPVGLFNTSIAAVFAVVVALVLWSVVFPDNQLAERRRFVRAARRALASVAQARGPIALTDFESAMGGALAHFRTGLTLERADQAASLETAVALLGAGRELILDVDPAHLDMSAEAHRLRGELHAVIAQCLSVLWRAQLDVDAVRAAAHAVAVRQHELALSVAEHEPARSVAEPARAVRQKRPTHVD
jgi:uncharacterized membrane protein YccC